MNSADGGTKRGRGRGRGTRGRVRGRGRGRGKKAAVVVSSDDEALSIQDQQSLDGSSSVAMEDADVSTGSGGGGVNVQLEALSEDAVMQDLNKENEAETQGPPAAASASANTEESISAAAAMSAVAATVAPAAIVSATLPVAPLVPVVEEARKVAPLIPQTIDMEADISQLEAPTFTTLSRGPPEPMLRLKWDHKVSLMGEKVLNPMIHCCDQCDKPILLYGRMIPCKHVFCLKCARAEPYKTCPRCSDKVVRVEQSGLGTVFMCTHGGSRYGNTGCRRTYLSQRDLQAHINHRHVTQPPPPMPLSAIAGANELKQDVGGMDALKSMCSSQRKLSESSAANVSIQSASALLAAQQQQRPPRGGVGSGIGSIAPPGSSAASAQQSAMGGAGAGAAHSHSTLTQANIARINTANEQNCHQSKVSLHQTLKNKPLTQSSHHQPTETVADASYYSSVLNSFGSGVGGGVGGGSGAGGSGVGVPNPNSAAAVGYSYEPPPPTNTQQAGQGSWQQNQYYR